MAIAAETQLCRDADQIRLSLIELLMSYEADE
jgi:hypothetical protein